MSGFMKHIKRAFGVVVLCTMMAVPVMAGDESVSGNQAKERNYVESVEGVSIVCAKQKVDISGEFSTLDHVKKYVVEPKGFGKVSKTGILVGKKPGRITIRAIGDSGEQLGSIEREVFAPKLGSMSVTKRGEVIFASDYLNADAQYLMKPTRWSITSSLASVDPQTGRITVAQDAKHGKAVVTAYFGDGSNAAKCKGTLFVDLPFLSRTKLTLEEGETFKLKLKNPPTDTPVIWSSSREKIATVNDNGRVKAKNEGKCEIYAKAGDYVYTCKLTVTEEE